MDTKFQFSHTQLKLLNDASIIHQKNELLTKVEKQLLQMGKETADKYPAISSISPLLKVSKGEKHQGLPFLVLDYPRIFSKENVFAIRCLVWWGKQISISLLLKGKYLRSSLPTINESLERLTDEPFYVETAGSIWQHELIESDKNYQLPIEEKVEFLKISCRLPIDKLNEIEDFYNKYFRLLYQMTDYGQKQTSTL